MNKIHRRKRLCIFDSAQLNEELNMSLKTFFRDKIQTVEEKEYCKFKSLLFSLLESLQALQKVLKKFYCNIITINKAVDDNLIGPVLIKTVLSLKKSYLQSKYLQRILINLSK